MGGTTYGEQIGAIGGLADEAFVDGDQFVLEMEQLPSGGVGEDLAARDRHDLAFAFADFAPVDVGDAEIIAGQRSAHQALFFHLQGHGLGLAEFGKDAEGRLEWLESHGWRDGESESKIEAVIGS